MRLKQCKKDLEVIKVGKIYQLREMMTKLDRNK